MSNNFKIMPENTILPFKGQLLKWVGNKQRFATEIISYFPAKFNSYYEPFLGSGAILGVLAPANGIASDVFSPLIGIWQKLAENPAELKDWYRSRWDIYNAGNSKEAYEQIKANYNTNPNPADLLFLCRACYGGIVRFRKSDGYMSTPCGPHKPIPPEAFDARVDIWSSRTQGIQFHNRDFQISFDEARKGDLIYCDPPYSHTQSILYGAQSFSLLRLFQAIEQAKNKGVYVALSIDGSKKSGNYLCDIPIPKNLFEREINIDCGRSMLRRFQKEGQSLHDEIVTDRLLLTY